MWTRDIRSKFISVLKTHICTLSSQSLSHVYNDLLFFFLLIFELTKIKKRILGITKSLDTESLLVLNWVKNCLLYFSKLIYEKFKTLNG